MRKIFFTSLLLSMYITLIGCGKTGPLYIPEQRYPIPPQEEKADKPNTPEQAPNQEQR